MTDPTPRPPARLAILFARDAPIAAIFRTGPVNTTALIEWNTRTDRFRLGQWVRHKVYPERSALSPDGRHLVYFAYRYHLRDGSRVAAVSRRASLGQRPCHPGPGVAAPPRSVCRAGRLPLQTRRKRQGTVVEGLQRPGVSAPCRALRTGVRPCPRGDAHA